MLRFGPPVPMKMGDRLQRGRVTIAQRFSAGCQVVDVESQRDGWPLRTSYSIITMGLRTLPHPDLRIEALGYSQILLQSALS